MLTKPFRPPLISKVVGGPVETTKNEYRGRPPRKKRRFSTEGDRPVTIVHDVQSPVTGSNDSLLAEIKPSEFSTGSRTTQIGPPPTNRRTELSGQADTGIFYNVLWRNFKVKKHKTWDGDGILAVVNGQATLHDSGGNRMGRTPCKGPLLPDALVAIGSKEVQIESVIPRQDLLTSHAVMNNASKPAMKDLDETQRTSIKFNKKTSNDGSTAVSTNKPRVSAPSSSHATGSSFKNPLKGHTLPPINKDGNPVPRHDPNATGALVMKRPAAVPSNKRIVDVVVDPLLSRSLREHQRTGVQFMYECVMGMRPFSGEGAILADEMGLGKTLQVIALLWTLLKQNPVHGERPIIRKALIVCPATLIKNWRKEFRKWLGLERVGVFVLEDKKTRLTDFTMGQSYNIMIIGYEKLRTVHCDLQKGAGIDIVIADEGHRLKTAQNKSAQAIKSLSTSRKIILSGTPLQNDLSEFYFMVDFVNPGLLGRVNVFKREFEMPILKSRQPGASLEDTEKGHERSEELASITGMFILRRTAEILLDYLPAKSEYILFCRPTSAQIAVYRSFMSSSTFSALLNTPEASLQFIGILKKLCNSPSLLRLNDVGEEGHSAPDSLISSLLSDVPRGLLRSPGASGKLQVLDSLLYRIHNTTNEKVVIVSHYTATLDILGNFLSALGYNYLRLDGSTSQSKRQDLVDTFNRSDSRKHFAFLLSAKSGGVGLNLIGASRLVLFDNDWNPSADLQAMARIHRDGQKRPCRIYRLLTKGALDEKIYQRQLTKLSLANSVVDKKISSSSFTRDELRDLFRIDEREACQTHELLRCQCGGDGSLHGQREDTATVETPREPQSLSLSSGDHRDAGEVMVASTTKPISEEKMQLDISNYQHISTAHILEKLSWRDRLTLDDVQEDEGHEGELDSLEKEDNVVLQDDVLVSSLRDPENRISYIFAKTSS